MNTLLARRMLSSLTLACATALPVLPVMIALHPTQAVAQEVVTVPSVDLKRYVGKWYEIARFPNSFQKKCIANVTAEYRARADGDVDVVNRCKVEGGVLDQADGVARVIEGSHNTKLQVRFAPAWLSWFPLVWGDYWIIDLDPDYSIATIGTPSRDYLWILSRKPSLSTAEYEAAVNNATKQGFDTSKLVKTSQQ